MKKNTRPNIITILVDDMGFSDLGCYGGEIETPHLNGMARDGARFTDFYCTPRCCPSRASLLTGLTPHKTGVGWMSFDWQSNCDPSADGYTGTLNRNCLTIAEALRGNGYRTYVSGKWHVTSELENKQTWPSARGFDRSFSLISGGTRYFKPTELTLDEKFVIPPEQCYLTDMIGDYSVEFVNEHFQRHGDDPFFMYVAYTAPHFPLEAPEESIAKYRAIYSEGWDALRRKRYERMKTMNIIRDEWGLPERPESVPAWDSLDAFEKVRQIENMATYAAMVEIMDANVGKLLAALRDNGQLDNTLIMFLSDNGACAEGPVMGSDTHYGECWAHLSNTPFRLYKHFTLQGGVQTPCIVHWPEKIPSKKNTLIHDWSGSLHDIMPTCLEVSGTQYPVEHHGNRLEKLDGISFAPVLTGDTPEKRPDICIEHEGNQMIRSGKYKLVRQHADILRELYDMDADRTELHNLADSLPGVFVELSDRYDRWEGGARILPWERVGQYRAFHGYTGYHKIFKQKFLDALAQASEDEIVRMGD